MEPKQHKHSRIQLLYQNNSIQLKKLLSLLLFFPLFGYGQLNLKKGAQIDSLQHVIKTAQHDSITIRAWMAWDAIIENVNPELHHTLNKNIYNLCSINLEKKLNNESSYFFMKSMARTLNKIGLISYNDGDYAKAIEDYTKSLKIGEKIGYKKGIAQSLNNIGVVYKKQNDYGKAVEYYTKSLKISQEIGYKLGVSASLYAIGYTYRIQNEYAKAIEFYTKSIKVREELEDEKGLANSFNNIGVIYGIQGNYVKAIDYYTKSLKIREKLQNKNGIASSLNNIGMIYFYQGEYDKAIEYYTKSLKIKEEIGDKLGLGNSLNNIGSIYSKQDDYSKAIKYYSKSLKIREKIGDEKGIAQSLNNLGVIYKNQGNYTKAMDYLSKGLKISKRIEYENELSVSLTNIGEIYKYQGNYTKALEYSKHSLSIAQKIGAPARVEEASKILWEVNKKLGNSGAALKMYELYITTRDSINSEENQKAVIRQEFKYQYEKQAAADSVKNAEARKVKDALLAAEKAENKQHKLEAEHQSQQMYFLFGGLALALLFGGFIYNRFRVTNKQKGIIEDQKGKVDEAYDELEEKNREVLDSINYAKRIQSAMLPNSKLVREYLPQSFILYKPKDIVAGDFYWLEKKDEKVFFAVADCTGHGVPGAMVSVVCNNGLNRSVREDKLLDPGKILDKTREIIIQEFGKSEEEVKDGMDIALCSLEGNTLKYAGAYNPLWIIRKGEILETKADKQPIGRFAKQKAFTTHTIPLEKEDTIYIFSDGYVDQFGGEKGKKLKTRAFRELLLSIQNQTMEEQQQHIDAAFEKWRGNQEQVDDVCVFGVRV